MQSKYIIYNNKTGYIIDIISTLIENRPIIAPIITPPFESVFNIDNIKVKNKEKAERALEICKTYWGDFKYEWEIKEINNAE